MKYLRVIPFLLALFLIFAVERSLYLLPTDESDLAISNLANFPKSGVKTIVLEFSNITADYLFLNTLTYLGEKAIKGTTSSARELRKVYSALDVVNYLDPRAQDPYVLAETTLPWEAGMIEETNQILLRSAKHRPEDHRPYFFLWFNYFYFLQDAEKSAQYLEKAAQVSGSPKYYGTLAARMRLFAGQHVAGIVFLEELIKETQNQQRRDFLQTRLEALRHLAYLENMIRIFKQKYNNAPESLDDLLETGIIPSIPTDPYGGRYYIMENGRVYTTSELVLVKKPTQAPQGN